MAEIIKSCPVDSSTKFDDLRPYRDAEINAAMRRIAADKKICEIMGNIYKVNVSGGVAAPVTTGSDYNSHPVWSHDGKTIAFASDKSGNFDVYTMSANGGVPMRLTYNSAADYPQDFTADNKFVLFNSPRNAPAKSVRFPSSRLFYNIYTVPVGGGRPILVSAAGMDVAHYNYAGTKIVFQDRKGYEDDYRKHHGLISIPLSLNLVQSSYGGDFMWSGGVNVNFYPLITVSFSVTRSMIPGLNTIVNRNIIAESNNIIAESNNTNAERIIYGK